MRYILMALCIPRQQNEKQAFANATRKFASTVVGVNDTFELAIDGVTSPVQNADGSDVLVITTITTAPATNNNNNNNNNTDWSLKTNPLFGCPAPSFFLCLSPPSFLLSSFPLHIC